jgi:hypothetical protein
LLRYLIERPQEFRRKWGSAAEEHLALVRVMPEERPLRQFCPRGNIGDGRLFVAASPGLIADLEAMQYA